MHSKLIGNANEEMFDLLCKVNGITTVKIPDGCRRINAFKLIQVKSPFDRILAYHGASAFVDYKHSAKKAFSYSAVDKDQLAHLHTLSLCGLSAGYLVYFSSINRIIYFTAHQLFNLSPGKSLKPNDGIDCGSQLKSNLRRIFLT